MTSKENFDNLFINKFEKNIWLVFLGSKFASNQFLSLRDSTIARTASKIQALRLGILLDFSTLWFRNIQNE